MSTRGRKQRPWRTLRCVVEVKVPPSNRSDEKDLIYKVEEALPFLDLPRRQPGCYSANPKVKSYGRVRQAETIKAGRPADVPIFEHLVLKALFYIMWCVSRGNSSARRNAESWREATRVYLGVEPPEDALPDIAEIAARDGAAAGDKHLTPA